MSGTRRALVVAVLFLTGCAGQTVPVTVATSDGAEHYAGDRSVGRLDHVQLTSDTGARCVGELHPTEEAGTRRPAAYGGVRCEDGRVGVLLFSGTPAEGGGAVSGVMRRRPVEGGWGSAAGRVGT